MKPAVAHLVRKSAQLESSFINNQIVHHQTYQPIIIFAVQSERYCGGFAKFDIDNYVYFNSGEKRKLFWRMIFNYFKTISRKESIQINRFLTQHNANMLHLHYGTDAGIFWRIMRDSGIPSIVSFYGYDCSSFPNRFCGFGKIYLKKRVFKYASKIVAMSPDMKMDLMAAGCPENKIIVHYHGIDTETFNYFKRHVQKRKKTVLLILSSLVPQKGHMFLLMGINELIKKYSLKRVVLRIVGKGELEFILKKYVKKESIHDYVKFIDAIPYASRMMKDEYQNADIFVQPSVTASNGDKEGIPGTIVEAMASGLPVISTFHAGIPFIIENGQTGLLVPEWDVHALAEGLVSLIINPDLRQRLSVQGQKYAIDELDIHRKEIELEKIYSSLIR